MEHQGALSYSKSLPLDTTLIHLNTSLDLEHHTTGSLFSVLVNKILL
jgi:hypothetical protein